MKLLFGPRGSQTCAACCGRPPAPLRRPSCYAWLPADVAESLKTYLAVTDPNKPFPLPDKTGCMLHDDMGDARDEWVGKGETPEEKEARAKDANRRVPQGDPILHAEIDCLRNAGRIGSYVDTTLYSTLMPCPLCSGAAVLFKVPKVIVGESRTFAGAPDYMRAHGIEVVDMDLDECVEMMRSFIAANPRLWDEDIGDL